MTAIARDVLIEVYDKKYNLKLPTNRQLINIEAMKSRLSLGMYDQMILGKTYGAQNALNMIDMICYLSVLCPDVLKDLKVDIDDLNVIDSMALLKVYIEKVEPWGNVWH